jgi:hypothetical protein
MSPSSHDPVVRAGAEEVGTVLEVRRLVTGDLKGERELWIRRKAPKVSIPEAWRAFDQTGNLKDVESEQRLREVGRQVARFAYLHTSEHALEFLRMWESAPANPGAVEI